ncbi:MAG: bacteriocin, partial [Prevotellaceae bacterium]|nr:bacteriocin [Candidatus Faecinaster equi]
LNNKLKELSEDELKTVIGGLYNDNMECPQRTCTFNSKEECPHANYGRMRVSDCKYN